MNKEKGIMNQKLMKILLKKKKKMSLIIDDFQPEEDAQKNKM